MEKPHRPFLTGNRYRWILEKLVCLRSIGCKLLWHHRFLQKEGLHDTTAISLCRPAKQISCNHVFILFALHCSTDIAWRAVTELGLPFVAQYFPINAILDLEDGLRQDRHCDDSETIVSIPAEEETWRLTSNFTFQQRYIQSERVSAILRRRWTWGRENTGWDTRAS